MTLLEDYVVDRFDLSPEWISKRAQNAQLSTVTQNRPPTVEIKRFKTGHCLGVKTALFGLITASPVFNGFSDSRNNKPPIL
jgi:hypothetical protein